MEEGLYEVDVRTLAVTELFRDEQLKDGRKANLPGYHGKGLFSGQGQLVYANNGENSPLARQKPDIPSGALASWDGASDTWTVVRRNQFTEVTGPGGITGNENAATDPIWTIGWDHRSLILMVLDHGAWHSYRLPKASHSYDGAHGWNTEWPRIRDIGETDLLMTMHGAFWRFPKTFSVANSAGIAPRSNYLKVVGDFTRWRFPGSAEISATSSAGARGASTLPGKDCVVLGCDDTALSEFLNKRRAKGNLAAPGQSQSNLWFIAPADLDHFGPAIGRGAVWLDDSVKKDEPSEPFLFSGFEQRIVHLTQDTGGPVTFTFEVDRNGNNQWTKLRSVDVPASGYAWTTFTAAEKGAWVRVRTSRDVAKATAMFGFRARDERAVAPAETKSDSGARAAKSNSPRGANGRFDGLLSDAAAKDASGGLLHARGAEKKTLGVAATRLVDGKLETGDTFYEMGPDMKLRRSADSGAAAWMQANVAIPRDAVAIDAASVIYTDESGKRFRLPKGRRDFTSVGPLGPERTIREVCTERDLLNCAGTFFEVPAENAGGIAKLRPIATHNRRIHDFATWRGMLVMSGVSASAPESNRHIIRSDDGRAAVWVGVVDDLWSFGRAVGEGGPWKDTAIKAGEASDPYLMTGYERKSLTLSHRSAQLVKIRVEVDLTGTGKWVEYALLDVPAGKLTVHTFPDGFQAYWVRVSGNHDTTATAWFVYE
jgi:hypothetical protein